ncbi:MAG: hypothetical protein QF724_10630 [Planctomycetota bacterium]|nr:hypothetical protein [Planctomycetota bacterium]
MNFPRSLNRAPAFLFTAFGLALWTAPALASDVHVVAADGSGDFTSLATAASAAADGDVLLVRPGDYGSANVVIDAKGLTIVKDGTGLVKSTGEIHARNLPAGEEIHLSGLSYSHTSLAFCDGRILIENFEPRYSLRECEVLAISSNSVTIANSELRGRDGYDITGGQDNYGANGGHALFVQDSTITLYSSTMQGGTGDDGAWLPCGIGGDGGDGLHVQDSASRVRYLDCTFAGGYRGYGGCGDGWEGADISAPAGTVIPLTMPVNEISGAAVIREGNSYTLTINGAPGHVPMLLTATAMFQRNLPPAIGVLHLPWPFSMEYLQPIPGNGVLNHQIAIPMLPGAEQSRWRIMQIVINDPAGRYLARPISLTVLDDAL